MKTFQKFKSDALLNESLLSKRVSECRSCGSPNLFEVEGFSVSECLDCGTMTNGAPVNEIEDPVEALSVGMDEDGSAGGGGGAGSGGAPGAGNGVGAGECTCTGTTVSAPSCPVHGEATGFFGDPSGDNYKKKKKDEEAPTNNVGSGNIAGVGIGPQGEPGVDPVYQRARKQLKLMNGPAVDPRMFRAKIFGRKPPQM